MYSMPRLGNVNESLWHLVLFSPFEFHVSVVLLIFVVDIVV